MYIGQTYYHIDGPQAYNGMLGSYPPQIQYSDHGVSANDEKTTPPSTGYHIAAAEKSKRNGAIGQEKAASADQIVVERYPNNDINIVTPRPTGGNQDQQIVVVVEADSDVELRPVSHRSRSHGCQTRHRSRSRHRSYGPHRARDNAYDKRLAAKGAQSCLKVSKWLDWNAMDYDG